MTGFLVFIVTIILQVYWYSVWGDGCEGIKVEMRNLLFCDVQPSLWEQVGTHQQIRTANLQAMLQRKGQGHWFHEGNGIGWL